MPMFIQRPTDRVLFIGNPAVQVLTPKKQTAATVYLWDTFVGTNNAAVDGRTPDTNANGLNTWHLISGLADAQIQSNRAQAGDGDFGDYYDVGHSDYTLTCLLNPNYYSDIYFRFVDTSNCFMARINADGDTIHIYKRDAGSFEELAVKSQSLVTGGDTTVTIICAGTSISVQVGAGSALTTNSSHLQTETKIGFHLNGAGSNRSYIDDLKVAAS